MSTLVLVVAGLLVALIATELMVLRGRDIETGGIFDSETLRRCKTCNRMLVRSESEVTMREHLGHHWIPVEQITVPEFLRIWAGWL